MQNLHFYGHTGYWPEEKKLGVRFRVDLAIGTDLAPAGHSDQLTDTLDYGGLVATLAQVVTEAHYNLLERLAEELARVVLQHPQAATVQVTLTKCHPPLPFGDFSVAVQIERDRAWATTTQNKPL